MGMSKLPRSVSVVVPIFNEHELVEELMRRLRETLDKLSIPYEIVFVDDGSRDGSLEKLIQLAVAHKNIRVIELSRNYGQTAALAAGIDAASGEVIVTMDGDLQHEPEQIPRFLETLSEGYDIVSGWRETRTDNALLRRLPSWCANSLMRYLSGVGLRDFASTFKAYRAELVKRIEFFGELHRFIPVLANRIGARMVEIPISVHPRKSGASKYGISRTFGVIEDLVFLEFYSHYLTKPIRAFGKLFFLFFGAGFLIAASLLGLWLVGEISNVLQRGGLLLFAVFLMIIGVQFLVAGILAELLSRIYLHTSQSKIYSVRNIHGKGIA